MVTNVFLCSKAKHSIVFWFEAHLDKWKVFPLSVGPGSLVRIKSLQQSCCQTLILRSKVCSIQAQMAHNKPNEPAKCCLQSGTHCLYQLTSDSLCRLLLGPVWKKTIITGNESNRILPEQGSNSRLMQALLTVSKVATKIFAVHRWYIKNILEA